MKEEIFLLANITHILVSVFTPKVSSHNFGFYLDQKYFYVDLLSSYSNTTPENVYVKYEVILNGLSIEKQYYPILNTNKTTKYI